MSRADVVDLRDLLQHFVDDEDDDFDIDTVDDSVAFPTNEWEEDDPTVEDSRYFAAVAPSRSTAMPIA